MSMLAIKGIHKDFGEGEVLKGVDLSVEWHIGQNNIAAVYEFSGDRGRGNDVL